MTFKFRRVLLTASTALFIQACASTPPPVEPKIIEFKTVERIEIAPTLLVRPAETTSVPILKSDATTRNKEDALLICAAEKDALRIQVNALLDALDGHVGTPEPVVEPEPEPEKPTGLLGRIFSR